MFGHFCRNLTLPQHPCVSSGDSMSRYGPVQGPLDSGVWEPQTSHKCRTMLGHVTFMADFLTIRRASASEKNGSI